MRATATLTCLGLLTVSAGNSLARDYSTMYPSAELQRVNGIYAPNLHAILFQDIAAYLSDDELKTLSGVTLLQPWDRTADPFEFAADARSSVILVPTLSVKFLDELAVATAWFERHKCNKEAVFDYSAALDFSHLELKGPLAELQVPHDAYRTDAYVDDVSQKILKSAVAFIVLHELGHVHLRHLAYQGISGEQAMEQEAAADRFAMQVLRRMRLPPIGMVVWFTAASKRDPLGAGSPLQTHPLSSDRLHAIADDLRRNPDDFIEAANRGTMTLETVRQIAADMDTIAYGLADPNLRSLLRARGRLITKPLLAGACKPERHDQDWLDTLMRHFGQ